MIMSTTITLNEIKSTWDNWNSLKVPKFLTKSWGFELRMGDPKSIFRALTSGISFDKKRFRNDAEKFGLTGKKVYKTQVKEFVTIPDFPTDFNDESNDATTNDDKGDSSDEQELQLLGRLSSILSYFYISCWKNAGKIMRKWWSRRRISSFFLSTMVTMTTNVR